MAKAFWKGVISFGMVVIPIKMYVATETRALSFHILHKKCLTRPKQVWHCDHDNDYFTLRETVRGYEYAKGQYVVVSEDDFKKVPVKTSHSINILGFIESGEIDSLYYRSGHYLEPEEVGTKPFALLREVLLKTKRVGIAKVTFQKREHLCALRPFGSIMALHTMYYHNELLDQSELGRSQPEIADNELAMAKALVTAMATSFKPEQYKDEYHDSLKKMVEAKVKGIEIKIPEEEKFEITDLMTALKASVEAARKKTAEREVVSAQTSQRRR